MFGLWFSIYGLICGTLCSIKAKEKNRYTKDWFLLGFVFGVFAFIFLFVLPSIDRAETIVDYNLQDMQNEVVCGKLN